MDELEWDELSTVGTLADFAACLRRLVRDAEGHAGRAIGRAGLAKRIGVSLSSLYAYLNGTTLISDGALANLVLELKVNERDARRARQVRNNLAEPHPGVVTVPQALPLDIASFTGRLGHLAELDRLLGATRKNATVVISAVCGIGGIGKTALAVHWAHRRRARFPGGCLYLDLQGFHPETPLPPAGALAALLRRLGVPGNSIPYGLDERIQLYQTLLAGKRTMIVLDNAYSTEQVRPLLPPGTSECFVVITSRDRLTGLVTTHGAHPLPVDVLSEDEARALLEARIGTRRMAEDPDAVATVLAACGGLPLALNIVASRVQIKIDMSLTELAAELRDKMTRLSVLDDKDPAASLPAVLSWSLRALSGEQIGVFGMLGIAPGPDISVAAASSLIGMPIVDTRRALDALEELSLLRRNPGGRYRMHGLVRIYARELATRKLTDAQRKEALRRVIDFYLHTAYAGDRLLDPSAALIKLAPPAPRTTHPEFFEGPQEALQWFESEYSCLAASQKIALTEHWNDHTWQLAWAMETFQEMHGHFEDRISAWQAGLAGAHCTTNPVAHIRAHWRIGDAYRWERPVPDALVHLSHALRLAEEAGDTVDQAHIYRTLGQLRADRGEYRQAVTYAIRSARLYRDTGMSVLKAVALNHAGWALANLDHLSLARALCRASLNLLGGNPDRAREASTLHSLGYISHHIGDYAEAVSFYQKAVDIRNDLGYRYLQAGSLDELGHTHMALDQLDRACAIWTQALKIYRELQRDDRAEQVQQQLGTLGLRKGST
ncbi:ATP-binding protein [Pseudonocardia acaciae]|uniref:ATP-binding protein n=1 Tax=Pseudonocardia acaciae TaxID=551276 RepID=UPI0006872F31|nr:tetratricopeptide repeat protein [Pseudonocardia acaciae]